MHAGLRVFFFLFDLVLPVGVGYGLARAARLRPQSFDPLMKAGILVGFPAMVMLSLWTARLERELLWLPFLGFAMQIVPGLLGWVRAKGKPYNSLQTGSYVMSAVLSNRGVVGGLSVFILFGEQGYACARLVMVLSEPCLFLFYFPVARWFRTAHGAAERRSGSWLPLIFNANQAPVLGVAAGFALNLAKVPRPEAFGHVFTVLMHAVSWMFLIPVGACLDLKEMGRHWRGLLDLLPIKFLATPLAMYLAARAVGLEGTALHTLTVLAFSPTAINAIITAKLNDLDIHVATAAFVLTTAAYVLVVFPAILGVYALAGWL